MTELLIFWTIVLIVTAVAVALREIHDDDPRRGTSYHPPRSHHDDPFSHTGASFR
jgi:hypothetical protein